MVSVKGSFNNAAPRLRAPAYHAIVSRVLQKRFVHACVCLYVLCYGTSFLLGHSYRPWYLFPWSWTGFRSVAIFLALAPLLLLRKANLHVTRIARPLSPFNVLSAPSIAAAIAYTIASTFFVLTYINNTNEKSGLTLLVTQRTYELPRLNERWLYLMFFSVMLAVFESGKHIACDLDLLARPLAKRPIPTRMQEELPMVAVQSLVQALGISLVAPLGYLILRSSLYSFVLRFVRLIYHVPRSTVPPEWPVGFGMCIRTTFIATLIIFAWNVLHWLFNVYLSQGPTYKGKLISEKSMLQDETLLKGLQHTSKPLTQLIAFEELRLIAAHGKDRRIAIFETGAPDATMWLAIVNACLVVLGEVIDSVSAASGSTQGNQPAHPTVQSAPKARVIGTPPPVQVHQANIFLSGHKNASIVDKLKSQTQPAAAAIKAPEQIGQMGQSVMTTIKSHALEFTKPMWQPVTELTAIRLLAKVLRAGEEAMPRHEFAILAIESLRDMLLASLEDDTFGRAHKDVSRVLTSLEKLQSVIARLRQYRKAKQQDQDEQQPLVSDDINTVDILAGDARKQLLEAFQAYL
ncbi:nucleoporin protein Ndc1-Nup [Protomyces lactucae-debilis]|uniref:Nucleoporin protein Ndc1-Nup n=1 Tax=Protomyces lactucae-debilis TaxID=2754530 RepID=A0A1Y2F536_PROLT|nr:nucleoporin protein Ndc1-Nup [Protomyces lactucae-debilis]ORY79038.1 nucleoporin protein Ndc1-Nup [Protomyces lactucae-debilis]